MMGICVALHGRADSIELVLHTIAGHEKVLALDAGMSISLDDDSKVIKITDANDDTLFEYYLPGIASICYQGDIPEPSGIGDVPIRENVKYTLTNEGINLQGLSAKTRIFVYKSNGQLVRRMSVSDKSCTILKADLPKGIVIVKINDEVIKIMNR